MAAVLDEKLVEKIVGEVMTRIRPARVEGLGLRVEGKTTAV